MKQKTKKLLILFLSLMMLLSSSALPLYASAQSSVAGEQRENPFASGEEIKTAGLDAVSSASAAVSKEYNSNTYYTEGVQIYKTVRNNLAKRNENFKIHLLSKTRLNRFQTMNLIEKLYINATEDELAQESIHGDYIRWAVSTYGYNTFSADVYRDGYYYYTIPAIFNYYDSSEEEAQVDKAVNSFISSINTNELTDYEIIKEVHDYICSKTTYDDAAASNINGREYAATAYGALVKGKCVCQGYALAFYRICKELGYNVRFVSSDRNEGCHAWNLVELDCRYYFVDTTWDDMFIEGALEGDNNTFFLVNYETVQKNDSHLCEHKLDEKYYDTEYFWENYREHIDENNYNPENKSLFSQSTVSLSAASFVYTGSAIKPAVSVSQNIAPERFTVSYSNNTNTGKATVNIVSSDNAGVLSHRNFIILPKKMGSLSLAESGRGTDYLKVKWSKAGGNISGYKLERYKEGKWSVIKTLSPSETSCKISSLSASTQYKFRIRSYVNISNKAYYGAYSKVYSNATKPKKPNAPSISTKAKSITFKWKKVACSGYEVQYGTNSSMKNAKTVFVSSSALSKKISKLKKGKKYYFRVRAYKTYTDSSGNKRTCYSAWSSKKNIICK